ncbi:hypothetical protein [Sphingomonas sp. PB1R3]|uniref:hypothetical protein n=1 Tax=Sphingomonas flavida TaxID=3096154 RepID=UPI002FC6EB51
MALWTLGRVAFLLPGEAGLEQAGRLSVAAAAEAAPPATPAPPRRHARRPSSRVAAAGPWQPLRRKPVLRPTGGAMVHARPLLSLTSAEAIEPIMPPPILRDAPASIAPVWPDTPSRPDRWSLGIWAVARQGGDALTPGGQLGGSQAGLRLLRRLDSRGAWSASLRLSASASGVGREMGVGLDWQPSHTVPVRVLVERRVALDRGPGGTALLAVTGIGPRPVAAGLTLTAYAQGGVVVRDRIEPFADGAMRVAVPLAPGLDLGIGLWGGAQRGAQRLDFGPTLGVAVPVGNRRVRLSLDWRQRVAGGAAPGSGPALSLAGDF